MLQKLAVLGHEPMQYGSTGLSASVRPTLPPEQRRQLLKPAELRGEAAAILVEADVDPRDLEGSTVATRRAFCALFRTNERPPRIR